MAMTTNGKKKVHENELGTPNSNPSNQTACVWLVNQAKKRQAK